MCVCVYTDRGLHLHLNHRQDINLKNQSNGMETMQIVTYMAKSTMKRWFSVIIVHASCMININKLNLFNFRVAISKHVLLITCNHMKKLPRVR